MAVIVETQELAREIERMLWHLRHAERSVLLIAATSDGNLERALAGDLTRRLAGYGLLEFRFSPAQFSLPDFVRALPMPDSHAVVFAYGLDDLPTEDRRRAINALNVGRENLRWSGYAVVLWLRPHGVSELTFQAPDFFAVRSGLFEFALPADPAVRAEALATLNVRGPATLDELRRRYIDYIIATYRWQDFRGLLQVRNLVRLRLEDVFIQLQAEVERIPTYTGGPVIEVEGVPVYTWRFDVEDFKRITGLTIPIVSDPGLLVGTLKLEGEVEPYLHKRIKRRVSTNEALREHPRMVVLGDPGTGKTTLLKYLALTFAEGEARTRERLNLAETRLPIIAPIAAYDLALRSNPDLALADFLPQYFAALGLPDLAPLFRQALSDGDAVLLLDGLDEVLSAETRSTVVRRVEALTNAYPRNRFIVTSRIAGYASAPLGSAFARLTVRPFERPEIETFARSWSRAYEAVSLDGVLPNALPREAELRAGARARSLTEAIFDNPSIERLATTPLLLTLLALIHYQGTRLPSRRIELYRLCVEALAETWNLARSLSGQPIGLWLGERRLDERAVVEILAPVAMSMHEQQPGGLIAHDELEARVASILQERRGESPARAQELARDFLRLVREQVGLLVERGPDQFGFMHLTFEEYLAARYLAGLRHEDRLARLRPHLHDPRWREVILLTAAALSEANATDFVRAIRNSNSRLNDVLHLDLFLAARCLADDVPVDLRLRRELVDAVVRLTLRGDYERLWEEAAMLLAAMRGSEAERDVAQELLDALRDKELPVRSNAASALGQLGQASDAVVNALLDALRDKDESVRSNAASALGQLGQASDAVVNVLLAVLRDEEALVRLSAASALRRLGQASDAVVNALLDALRDKDEIVRSRATSALGQLGQASDVVVNALLDALRDESSDVRSDAAWALGRLGQASDAVVNALLDALRDRDESVRSSAAEALGGLGRATPKVIRALRRRLKGRVGQAAFDALWELAPRLYTADAGEARA